LASKALRKEYDLNADGLIIALAWINTQGLMRTAALAVLISDLAAAANDWIPPIVLKNSEIQKSRFFG
jgi:hypothetical protein